MADGLFSSSSDKLVKNFLYAVCNLDHDRDLVRQVDQFGELRKDSNQRFVPKFGDGAEHTVFSMNTFQC